MDITTQHPWHERLLAPLMAEQIASAIVEDDPQWEYIDGEMVKVGSLAHATLNIEEIQQHIVSMLSKKSKDFRLMVHLLRTLQHAGDPEQLMLAVSLLTRYIQHFWSTAWPANPVHKRRFAQQILKRFDSASASFSQQAGDAQREDMQGLLAHLAQVWHNDEPALAKDVDTLRSRYARKPDVVAPAIPPRNDAPPLTTGHAVSTPAVAASLPDLSLDHSNEKAWRQTLFKLAEVLSHHQADNPIGYRLRRYAIWGTISALPMAQSDGRTPLAAVAADRVADYLAGIATADLTLWRQVEQSLTLAPYWLEGHVLSARIAAQLGYDGVARAIRDELNAFLTRLPGLRTLFFTDMTPFLSAASADWLQDAPPQQGGNSLIQQDEIWQCYQQQGLETALQMLEQQPQSEPRARFYTQLLSAQLLEKAGMTTLAQQQYSTLLQVGTQRQLSEWEPSLIAVLTEKQRQQEP